MKRQRAMKKNGNIKSNIIVGSIIWLFTHISWILLTHGTNEEDWENCFTRLENDGWNKNGVCYNKQNNDFWAAES